jgi:hypothetical protein
MLGAFLFLPLFAQALQMSVDRRVASDGLYSGYAIRDAGFEIRDARYEMPHRATRITAFISRFLRLVSRIAFPAPRILHFASAISDLPQPYLAPRVPYWFRISSFGI